VHAGEVLGHLNGAAVKATRDGVLLFPKYPRRDATGQCLDPVAGELFHIAAPLAKHPQDLWKS
jgi:hypothetical protein